MKLLVATESSGSGLGRFTVELANALQGGGADVTFLAPAQGQAVRVARWHKLAAAKPRGRLGKILALAGQSLDLARQVWREAGPEQPLLMVHIHPTLPVSLLPLIAARARGARLVLSLHDFYPHTLRFPARLQGLERWLYRRAYCWFALILTNNEEQTRRLIAEARIPPERIATLFHGPFVVPDLAPPSAEDEALLLVFGSLRPNKQVLESIRAIKALRAQGVPVRLRIAGAPRREDAAYWQACLAEIPVGDPGFDVRAHFIADEQLGEVLSGVDAMLCPYRGFDSQSGVAVVAVSNGVPLLGTAEAGVAGDAPPWPLIDAQADGGAIAEGVTRFLAMPRTQRLDWARAQQQAFLARAGWARLAQLVLGAMRDRGM